MNFADKFKMRCKELEREHESMREVEKVEELLIPMKLYNIVKRSTNAHINKVVAIGFTLSEANDWVERKVNQAKEVEETIVFYEIVDQENKQALDPYWNPRPFIIGEAA